MDEPCASPLDAAYADAAVSPELTSPTPELADYEEIPQPAPGPGEHNMCLLRSCTDLAGFSVRAARSRRGQRKQKAHDNTEYRLLIKLVDHDGLSVKEAADTLEIPAGTAYWIIARHRRDPTYTAPKPRGGAHNSHRFAATKPAMMEALTDLIGEQPSVTLRAMRAHLQTSFTLVPTMATISQWLENALITHKSIRGEPEKRNDEERIEARFQHASWWSQLSKEQSDAVVFIDEHGVSTWSHGKCGWSKKGVPCFMTVPATRGTNVSTIAAISSTLGAFYFQTVRGPVHSEEFVHFLRGCIQEWESRAGPQHLHPPITFVFDNLSVHGSARVRSFFDSRSDGDNPNGHQCRFLPAWSPFLNPIETIFSIHKLNIRRLIDQRSQELLDISKKPRGTITEARFQFLEKVIGDAWAQIELRHIYGAYTDVAKYLLLSMSRQHICGVLPATKKADRPIVQGPIEQMSHLSAPQSQEPHE
jgi:transposase